MTRLDSPGTAPPGDAPSGDVSPTAPPPAAATRPEAPARPASPPVPLRARRSSSPRRLIVVCAVIAAALHTLAVVWTWQAWSPGARGSWLVWLDLPVSLAYLDRVGSAILPWSLVAGGLQWAATGALLAWALGRAARRRRRP